MRLNTISFKITVICLSAALLMTLLSGFILLSRVSEMIRQENKTYLEHALQNINASIDSIIYGSSQSNRLILNNVSIQDILIRSQSPGYSSQEYITDQGLLATLLIGLTVHDGIYFASFYGVDGTIIFNNDSSYKLIDFNLFQDEWIADNKENIDSRNLFIVPPKRMEQTRYANFWPYLVVRPLKDIVSKQVIAYVVIFADCRPIQEIVHKNYTQLAENSEQSLVSTIRLLDPDGYVIASSNTAEIGHLLTSQLRESAPSRLKITSDYTNFTVVIDPNPHYFSHSIRSALLPLILLLLVIFLVLGLIIITALQIKMRPLQKLTRSMKQVGRGDFKLLLDEESIHDDDIRNVYRGFNRMTKEIDDLITNIYEQQLLLKSAQIENLKYQINPHFLYNTLQTIESIAEIRDIPDVQTITMCLSKIFRYNLTPENIVTLREELAHLASYFEIERIRFRDRILFQVDIQEEYYQQKIPKFILQPIVENAIIHAFQDKSVTCLVRIYTEISKESETLLIHVIDNGVGISEQVLVALQENLKKAKSNTQLDPAQESIGIANVQKRIINCCGEEYGIWISSEESIGTNVTISLPLY